MSLDQFQNLIGFDQVDLGNISEDGWRVRFCLSLLLRPTQSKQCLSWSLDSQTKVPEVGVRSEQATEHSAPSPSTLVFELNPIVSVFAVELKLFGPLLWQNLVKRWNNAMQSEKYMVVGTTALHWESF